jgi:hypothetical protein
MSGAETELLAQAISEKHACLVSLRELGRRQAQWIVDGDMERLLRLLAVKQQMIEQLQEIEKSLHPLRQQDPETRQWASERARQQCADQSAACQALLVEIVSQEKCCAEQLARRRDEVARRLEAASTSARTRGAYCEHHRTANAVIDLTSET